MGQIDRFLEDLESRSRKSLRPGDYIDEADGLTHCGTCHQPREARVKFPDGNLHVVGVTCNCDKQAEAERKRKAQESRIQRRIAQLRSKGITASRYADSTFSADMELSSKVNESRFSNNFIEKRDLPYAGSLAIWGFPLFHVRAPILQNAPNAKLIFLCMAAI